MYTFRKYKPIAQVSSKYVAYKRLNIFKYNPLVTTVHVLLLHTDTVDHSARSLLKCCAHHLAKRYLDSNFIICHTWLKSAKFVCRFSAVHLFLFDIDSNQWLSGLSPEVADKYVSSLLNIACKADSNLYSSIVSINFLYVRITVHDGFSDPLGWDADKNPPSSLVCLKNCSAQSFIDSLGEKPPRKDRAVLIDSLSSLLLHQSPAAVCRMIHTLGASNKGSYK